MRFGLFYEHQLPRPWAEDSEERLLHNALDQIELADQLGFDHVWEVEHHFLEEYSHSSAPEVFLAAASQRTKNIRLGHGIVQLPVSFNHPVRVAERIATLDLVSNGRVDFGTGESSSQMELGGFGIKREEKRPQWDESISVIARMLVEEPFTGHEGEFISVPPRNIVPKPKQKPHPPLWVACSRRETILLAARKGLGALSFSFIEPEEAKEWVDEYYRILTSEECEPAGFNVNPNLSVVVPLMCHEDEDTAIQRGIDGAHFFGYSLAHYYVFGEHRPGRTNIWEEFQEQRGKYGFAREIVNAEGAPLGMQLLQRGLGSMRGAVGTPDQIVEFVERYEAAGVDQIIFAAQCGNIEHEHVLESLALFGQKVLPRFKENVEKKDHEKSERLAESVERAMSRRKSPAKRDDDYLVTPSGEPGPARSMTLTAPAKSQSAEEAFLGNLRGKTDDELNRAVEQSQILQLMFTAMAGRFEVQYARGFTGEIAYELKSDTNLYEWTVTVDSTSAKAEEKRAAEPALNIRVAVVDFLRMATGELNSFNAIMEGKLQLEGDMQLATRLGEMFGTSRF